MGFQYDLEEIIGSILFRCEIRGWLVWVRHELRCEFRGTFRFELGVGQV